VNFSFADQVLNSLTLDTDIMSAVYHHFRRQPYFATQPRSYFYKWGGQSQLGSSSNYHIDIFKLLTVDLLVNARTVETSRMQLAAKSHKTARYKYNAPHDAERVEKKYEIIDFVGPKGTLYIWDNSCLHRGVYVPDDERKRFVFQFTTGHHIDSQRIDFLNMVPDLDRRPSYVNRALSKICAQPRARD
jgi:hypothetical protein